MSLLSRSSPGADFKTVLGLNNFTVDVCSYMQGGFNSRLLDSIMSSLKMNSNFMQPCPYAVNYFCLISFMLAFNSNLRFQGNFYSRDLVIDPSRYPIPLPAAQYKLQVFTYTVRDEKILWILEVNALSELKRK